MAGAHGAVFVFKLERVDSNAQSIGQLEFTDRQIEGLV